MICKKCRTEYNGNFCPNCGTKKELICVKCGAEYVGDFCTNCGAKTIKQGKLLGFRTNKTWKKVFSIIYMIIIGVWFLVSFTSVDSVNDVVRSIQEMLFMVAPYIFLSNFRLRNVLPLFKKHKKGLSFLGMIFVYFVITILCTVINPSTYCDHSWKEIKTVEATCTEDGRIESHCDLCDSDNTEYIDKKGHTFEIKEDTKEKIVKVCSVCGEEVVEKKDDKQQENQSVEETKTERESIGDKQDTKKLETTTTKKSEHKHKWVKATCENPSVCNECGETKGTALGHTTDCGVCSRCDKEFRKQSPVTILNWTYTIDYVGGVEWNFRIRNNTDKQIKYVTMQWDCYNAVGDLIYDEIGWKSYVRVRFTGPLDAHAISDSKRNTDKFYNYNLKSYKMTEIIVEYMDGTTEKVTNYYDDIIE